MLSGHQAQSRPSQEPSPETPVPARTFSVRVERPETFSSKRVQQFRHDFHEHPLMQLPALAALAKELVATEQCRFLAPGATLASQFGHEPRPHDGRDIDEVFRRIEEPGSWIALYNVQTHPAYRAFLAEVMQSFRPLVERQQSGVREVGGFIFISAPPSVTPFHIDRENNFWLQVRGRKNLFVWDHTDRDVVAGVDVDHFILFGSLEKVRLKDGHQERAHAFDVGPGDGVYFPSTSPHATKSDPGWTRPGDGVSVSIGVVFYTDQTRRDAHVRAWNVFLRKFGLEPRQPGRSAAVDRMKAFCGRVLVWGWKTLRGFKPKKGF